MGVISVAGSDYPFGVHPWFMWGSCCLILYSCVIFVTPLFAGLTFFVLPFYFSVHWFTASEYSLISSNFSYLNFPIKLKIRAVNENKFGRLIKEPHSSFSSSSTLLNYCSSHARIINVLVCNGSLTTTCNLIMNRIGTGSLSQWCAYQTYI